MLDALVETLEEKGVMTTEEWEQKKLRLRLSIQPNILKVLGKWNKNGNSKRTEATR